MNGGLTVSPVCFHQGLDVLEIMRNIHVFVSRYLYNLNNQVRLMLKQAALLSVHCVQMLLKSLFL